LRIDARCLERGTETPKPACAEKDAEYGAKNDRVERRNLEQTAPEKPCYREGR
jgi:hypothetical protein